eukprot:CAMPEP_0172035272 /NCGR_PEP_ID=MMETSP1041-20130122/21489_1 /TAXON_ID=464988 /ORGANISM="Hemiselmis andersenii, Strain CCMP439" /LENGTH=62 /DNA_ID=CAMNT_0012692317 /DNA_START=1 /DNA_END=186 /DNA_ORIENTATION=+
MENALQREREKVKQLRRELQDDRGGLRDSSFGRHRLSTLRQRAGSPFEQGAEEERQRELMGK